MSYGRTMAQARSMDIAAPQAAAPARDFPLGFDSPTGETAKGKAPMVIKFFPAARIPQTAGPELPGALSSENQARRVALIAAHNEEARIAAALTSLAAQTLPPDEVIVVADRCTDRTADVAVSHGAKVYEIDDNQHRKAGALNRALQTVLPDLSASDEVLLMDADTVLNDRFLEAASHRLAINEAGRPPVVAVGGVFLAPE
jgi:cellulose synthase/poly-beta-1,6-N-acetylglucosamine synthase-like glycosyltransferase